MSGQAPDFIGVGAQRAGTSWMGMCFWAHSGIHMPGKELQFFNQGGDINLADYFAKFNQVDKKQGEFTPDYLSDRRAIDRIAEHCPNTKLIVILREPVSRTISAYKLYRERQVISADTTLDEIFDANHSVYQKSLYGEQLEYLFSKIDKQRVLVCFYDQITEDPVALIQSVYRFIGVDDTVVPENVTSNFNASSVAIENPTLNNYLTGIQNYLCKRPWGRTLLAFKQTERFKRFKQGLIDKKKTKLSQQNVAASYRHYFKDDLMLLKRLIDRNLPAGWEE